MNNFLFMKQLVSLCISLVVSKNNALFVCVGGRIGLYISDNKSASWSSVLHW